MKLRYALVWLVLALGLGWSNAATVNSVNTTNELVLLNPNTVNTNYITVTDGTIGDGTSALWTYDLASVAAQDSSHLKPLFYNGRWIKNLMAGGTNTSTLVAATNYNVVAGTNIIVDTVITSGTNVEFTVSMTNVLGDLYVTNLYVTNFYAGDSYISNLFVTNLTVNSNTTFKGRVTFETNITIYGLVSITNLTPNTVVQVDANTNLASIANAEGVLTNDGSGAFGWMDITSLIGSQVWTNDNGVITPSPGQTTNVLAFTSGLADTSTNVALVLDTSLSWTDDESKLISFRYAGTQQGYITRWGGFRQGQSVVPDWNPDSADAITTIHDVAKGESQRTTWYLSAINDVNSATNYGDITLKGDSYATYAQIMVRSQLTNTTAFVIRSEADYGDEIYYDDADNTGAFNDRYAFRVCPTYNGSNSGIFGVTGASAAYRFGTTYTIPTGNIIEVPNQGTNKFTLAYDGSGTFAGSVTTPTINAATANLGTGKVTNNIGAILSVGDTTFVDMTKASQTNELGGDLTIAYATNGVDLVEYTHVRTLYAAGANRTVNLPAGWHNINGTAIIVTNSTVVKLYVTCDGPTGSTALQTNVFSRCEYYP